MPVDARGFNLTPNTSGFSSGVGSLIQEQINKRLMKKSLDSDSPDQNISRAQLASRDPNAANQIGSIFRRQALSEEEQRKRAAQVKEKQQGVMARIARTVSSTSPEATPQTLESLIPLLSQDPDLAELIPDIQEDIERFSTDPQSVIDEYSNANLYFTDPNAFQRTTEERQRAALLEAVRGGLDENGKLKPKKDLTAEQYSAAVALKMVPAPVGSAEQTITNQGTVDDVADTRETLSEAGAKGSEKGKQGVLLAEAPKVAAATRQAVLDVEASAKIAEENRSNAKALSVYNIGMENVTSALGETPTGTFMGLIPALSSDAKTAEGAISVMAPVLKSVFRSAGEGTFTDQDQKLLMGMLPKRTDSPKTRASKAEMVDSIVQAKLGASQQAVSDPSGLQGVDLEAYNWAKSNPDDPRAAAIIDRLGVK